MAVIKGKGSADLLRGTGSTDRIFGLGGNDTLYGFGGADFLNGGFRGDVLRGGKGNDSYRVDNKNDVAIEASGALGGIDTVLSSVTWTLGAAFENLTLVGGENLTGTGNAADNIIKGNGGGNVLLGNKGNDALKGGGSGDTLDGGAGADSFRGGTGQDIFSFKNEDGFFNNAGFNDWDDIVYDYFDGEDFFDVTRANGTTVDLIFYSSAGVSPNGLVGTEVAYGGKGGNYTGSFFVVGYTSDQHSDFDFLGVVTIDQITVI
jgi:Ca2+-binding RTX toxin-like protein